MPNRNEQRKDAYKFILEMLSKLPTIETEKDELYNISLDELRLLKEGINDPSKELVSIFKYLLNGIASKAEIERHLVIPFLDNNKSQIQN